MAAIVMSLMVFLVGASIDLTRLTQSSSNLKLATDVATLHAAKNYNLSKSEREDIFVKVMNNTVEHSDNMIDYDYDLQIVDTETTTTVTATTSTTSPLFFSDLWHGNDKVYAYSEVVAGREHLEVSLVLDISSSMNNARLDAMKSAAKSFISILLNNPEIEDRISISIVPFGGTVRLPSELEYMLETPDTTDHWVDGAWNGCLFMPPSEYSAGISPDEKFTYLPALYTWNQTNPWCPHSGNELIGLTNNTEKLENLIDSFARSDGTGTDIGAAWGYAMLDPQWSGRLEGVDDDMPRAFNAGTQKIMIVMSDGGITRQHFPSDTQLSNNPPITTGLPVYTKRQVVSGNAAQSGYIAICNLAKSNDVKIYTVGFLINNNNNENKLKACATSDANHYEADLTTLEGVFKNIASLISPMRLTQ
jgi:Flp pilus assembly protein TadG